MSELDLSTLAATYRHALLDDCLPFWFPRCLDREHGGFLHCRDRDGSLVDSDKSVWAHGRAAWMLLTLHNALQQPELRQWGESCLHFLSEHCFDNDGRMFFQVSREGRPLRKRRYAYSEAFAAIAYAAHARATGNPDSARRARELFTLLTRWFFTPGLMPPKFTAERPAFDLTSRMITIVTAQELRANLGDEEVFTEWIDRAIGEIRDRFVRPELECVMEIVTPEGTMIDHFDGRTLNPGHAIEAAWFILREGQHRRDDELTALGCRMLDWMWQRGWDPEYGGLFYFRDVYGKPVQEYWHDMKFWWPHNEALIATLLAWRLTREPRYLQRHRMVHEWAFAHFADPLHGDWFGYLHRDGRLSVSLKGNMWKAFFHLPRALWLCWQWCDEAARESA